MATEDADEVGAGPPRHVQELAPRWRATPSRRSARGARQGLIRLYFRLLDRRPVEQAPPHSTALSGSRAPAVLPAALRRAAFPEPVLEILRSGSARPATAPGWWAARCATSCSRRGRAGRDFDLATPATPQQVMALFPRVIPTGIDHGTVTVLASDRQAQGGGDHLPRRGGLPRRPPPGSVTFHTDLERGPGAARLHRQRHGLRPAGRRAGRSLRRPARPRRPGSSGRWATPAARFGEDGLRPLRAVRFAGAARLPAPPGHPRGHPRRAAGGPQGLGGADGRGAARASPPRPTWPGRWSCSAATGLLELVLPPLAALPPARRRHPARWPPPAPPDDPPRRSSGWRRSSTPLPAAEVEALLDALRFPRRVGDEAAALVARHECLREGDPEDPVAPAGGAPLAGRPRAAGGSAHLLALRDAEAAARGRRRRPGGGARRAPGRGLRGAASRRRWRPGRRSRPGELALDGRALMAAARLPPGPARRRGAAGPARRGARRAGAQQPSGWRSWPAPGGPRVRRRGAPASPGRARHAGLTAPAEAARRTPPGPEGSLSPRRGWPTPALVQLSDGRHVPDLHLDRRRGGALPRAGRRGHGAGRRLRRAATPPWPSSGPCSGSTASTTPGRAACPGSTWWWTSSTGAGCWGAAPPGGSAASCARGRRDPAAIVERLTALPEGSGPSSRRRRTGRCATGWTARPAPRWPSSGAGWRPATRSRPRWSPARGRTST